MDAICCFVEQEAVQDK